MKQVKRGDIYFVELGNEKVGSEQCNDRYAVVIQNDVGNTYSPTTIVAFLTSQHKKKLPVHMNIRLFMPSTILLEQIRTVDKRRLGEWVGHLTDPQMQELDDRLKISLGLN